MVQPAEQASTTSAKKPFRLNTKGKILAGGAFSVLVVIGAIVAFSHPGSAQTEPQGQAGQGQPANGGAAGSSAAATGAATSANTPSAPVYPPYDHAVYEQKMLALANVPPPPAPSTAGPTTKTVTTLVTGKNGKKHKVTKTITIPPKPVPVQKPSPWPAKNLAYPNPGALLPFNRIVAFYGNFYSKGMGILGQYPADIVLQKLAEDVKAWEAADPTTPVIPAIHYIATTAQKYAGSDGKHILRMPFTQIEKAHDLAKEAKAITFLDIQTGGSTVQHEVPLLETYLKMPDVHLGIDPEFSMKPGKVPGTVVGTMDASDINWVAQYLAKIVRDNHLPPKVLVIHRFTQDSVTNVSQIKPLPEVEIVIDMDGWGTPDHKLTTYRNIIYPQPVQFTGFKIFYHNDMQKPSQRLMTPAEIMKLQPIPSYIQYQSGY